jgi:O-antigen/teichoic acid export membrane protein
VARLLGPGPRGELAEVQFWAGAVAALGICSLPSTLSFFIARKENQASLAGSAFVLATALAFVSVLVGLILLNFAVDPALRNLAMLYLAFFVPANFIGLTLVAIDHGNQNFARYNTFRLLPQATYLSCILLLWHYDVLSIPMLLAASWLGTFFVCLGRWRLAKPNAGSTPNRKQIGKLLRTGLTYHTTAFAGILFQNADRFLCVTHFSHEDLGRYAVALTVSGAGLGLVSSATSIVLFPKLAAENGTAARRHLIRNALGASCVIALITNTTLALILPVLLPVLFGKAFAEAVPVAMLLCFAQIPASFVQTSTIALRALDDWRAGPYAQILGLFVFAPSAFALAPRFDLDGIAISLLISQAAAANLLLRRMQSSIGLKPFECLTPEMSWVASRFSWRSAQAS